MSELYPYADQDRLQDPHSYMYTPFVGAQFFTAYAIERTQTWDFFLARSEDSARVNISAFLQEQLTVAQRVLFQHPWDMENSDRVIAMVCACDVREHSIPDIKANFVTMPVLENLLTSYDGQKANAINMLGYLAERFERGKCLREEYNKEDRTLGEKLYSVLPYTQCAVLLGIHCVSNVDYKLLNAYLKIMDTICSVKNQVEEGSQAAIYALMAILLERAVVAQALQEI